MGMWMKITRVALEGNIDTKRYMDIPSGKTLYILGGYLNNTKTFYLTVRYMWGRLIPVETAVLTFMAAISPCCTEACSVQSKLNMGRQYGAVYVSGGTQGSLRIWQRGISVYLKGAAHR
jgi:hypothetical protein